MVKDDEEKCCRWCGGEIGFRVSAYTTHVGVCGASHPFSQTDTFQVRDASAPLTGLQRNRARSSGQKPNAPHFALLRPSPRTKPPRRRGG